MVIGAAMAQTRAGNPGQGARLLDDALRTRPDDVPLLRALGQVRRAAGDNAGAAEVLARAHALAPDAPGLAHDAGRALLAAGRPADAAALLTSLHARTPADPGAGIDAASACIAAGRFDDAWAAYQRLAHARPRDPEVFVRWTDAAIRAGEVDEAVRAARDGMTRFPDSPETILQACVAMAFADDTDPDEHTALHRRLGELVRDASPPAHEHFFNDPDPDRPLRVAFYSTDFRRHACAFFLNALLPNLDPAHALPLCYALHAPDDVSRTFAARFPYRELGDLAAEEIREIAASDAVDVLVDCSGWSRGHRMDAIARPIAPVQVAWLGYSNTSGLPGLHHRFVDAITDPPGTDRWATESLVRVPGCFIAYAPPAEAPAPGHARPPDAPFVFGSFNRLEKVQHATLRAWGEVLARTPGGVLLLKDDGTPGARVSLERRLAHAGGDPARLRWTPFERDVAAHLAAHDRMDLALDPFPYNGTTTTCEALLMGVPVVALAGRVHRARVGASLLHACGLGDLVAPDIDSYVRLATDLARDPTRLADLRRTTRDRFLASPVCDGPGFARRFEGALRETWRAWCTSRRR